MNRIITILVLTLSVFIARADIYSDTDQFLSQYVADGLVDYAAIAAKPASLNALVEQYEKFNLNYTRPQEQKAFWINAYNVMVIKAVVLKYPIASPKDVPGFFDKAVHNVASQVLSLNDIENKMLRARFPDARIHFVLVCAALSCPRLPSFAFLPRRIDAQLETQTRLALNDPGFIKVNLDAKSILISEIFKWYKDDFIASHNTVIGYINAYRDDQLPVGYGTAYYTYDWRLNEKKNH